MVLNRAVVRDFLARLTRLRAPAKLRVRRPWNTPFGSPARAPAPEMRGAWPPEAAAEALRALALPASVTLLVAVVAPPPPGLNATSSW
jgi:hypothetical protein